MKKYFFVVFIILLGLFTAYAFYAVWHVEEVNTHDIINQTQQEKPIKELTEKEIISQNVLSVPEESLRIESPAVDEEIIEEKIEKLENIPNFTPQQMEAQTQEIYESLTPEDYEETMEEANTAFEEIDAHIESTKEKLAQEMQAIEETQEIDNEKMIEEVIQKEEPMPVAEDEEVIDMENEDVNNL